jgi:hypothetical protein
MEKARTTVKNFFIFSCVIDKSIFVAVNKRLKNLFGIRNAGIIINKE